MEDSLMKKISLILMTAFAVAAVSCNKEVPSSNDVNAPEAVKAPTLVARISADDTKTAFVSGVYMWKTNDNFVVRSNNANGYTTYQYSGEPTAGAAEFVPKTDDAIVYGQNSFAIYPAKVSGSYPCEEDGSLKVVLKDTYTWAEGNVEAPMLARVETGQPLEFKHLGGVLKVTYKNVPPKATKLVVSAPVVDPDLIAAGKKTYKICSTMNKTYNWTTAGGGFDPDPANVPYVKAYDHSGEYKITEIITAATAAQKASSEGITVYVPLPVGPVSVGGKNVYPQLNVWLAFDDNTVVPGTLKTANNIQIERGHIKPMPAITLTKYKLTTLIGSAGKAASTSSHVTGSFAETKLYAPRGMVMLPDNKAVVFDQNDAVMFVDLNGQTVEKVSYNSGNAVPWGGCYHSGVLYIVDKSLGRFYTCSNLTTKEITYSNISTGNYSPMMIQFSGSDAYVVIRDAYGLFKYEGGITGTKTKFADFNSGSLSKVKPISFTVDGNGDFIIATADNGFKLFKESSAGGAPVAVAGNGTKATNYAALVDGPVSTATFTANTYGLAFDGDGNLYVGDGFAIRKITFGPGGWDDAVVTTIITNGTNTPKDGYGADAALNCVGSMAFNSDYSKLYVTDQNAGKVYVVTIE